MENITENNKLIAEFMGLGKVEPYYMEDLNNGDTNLVFSTGLKYNTSWDWLMPVVEIILNLQDAYAQERQKVFNSISPDINTTYTAVISFIKWYNENKQHSAQ